MGAKARGSRMSLSLFNVQSLFHGGAIYGQPRSCLAGGAKGEFKKGIGMCDEDHPYSGAVCLPSELVQDHQRGCLIVDRRAGDLATITGGTTKSKLFPQGNGWHNAPWSVVRLFLTVGGV